MLTDLYNTIQKSCGYVTVILDDEVISQGSCFSFTKDGCVITAAHVVTGRMPIKAEDYQDPDARVFIKFSGIPLLEYKVVMCGISIEMKSFTEDVQLDIAILRPKENISIEFPFLHAKILNGPKLGQQVFLAGFSDDLVLPFNLDNILDKKTEGADKFAEAMKMGYLADMTGALIKKATVGIHRSIKASNSSQELSVDIIYLDNGMNSGASGGPIVNEEGEVIGVITQRAVTSASQSSDVSLKVPSGTSIGISLTPILILAHIEYV